MFSFSRSPLRQNAHYFPGIKATHCVTQSGIFLVFVCGILFAQQPPGGQRNPAPGYSQSLTQNGINVRVSVESADPAQTGQAAIEEGQHVRVRFQLTDAATDSPVVGAAPAAWLDRKPDGEKTAETQCVGKVKRLAEGSTFSRTELDLTAFYVAVLNNDPTITVVDPRFGYGDTRLLEMVQLESQGKDWALLSDGSRLFVSMPEAGKVAVIDASSWKVIDNLATGARSSQVALQPDEAYLWVGIDDDEKSSGVAVVDARNLKIVARIPAGKGSHHIAFSNDSSLAFVTNSKAGTVSVIDVRSLAKLKDIQVGVGPGWISFSRLAQAAYVANEGDGTIAAVDGKGLRVLSRIEAAPGLGQIRAVLGGRYVIVVNPGNDHLYVIDTASNRIVQSAAVDKEPDQIAFTDKQIHIRHRGSDEVLMMSLDLLGKEGPVALADFSAGRHAPGKMSTPTQADGLVQASGENGVLIANPGDKAVYFYMEGMAAPVGNFSDYGHEPRAVLPVERNLRERSPGVYETTVKLPAPGSYDLAFLLDQPRVISCFDFPVRTDPARAKDELPKLRVEARLAQTARAGNPYRITFRVTNSETNLPKSGLQDFIVLMESPGLWQRRQVAKALDDGLYVVEYVVPQPGRYLIFAAAPSAGLSYAQYAAVTVQDGPN
jgi:YVTN family beta-propeller protein